MGKESRRELDESHEFVGTELLATILGVCFAFATCLFGSYRIREQVRKRVSKCATRNVRGVSGSQTHSASKPSSIGAAPIPSDLPLHNPTLIQTLLKYRYLESLAMLALCSVVIANVLAFVNYSLLYIFMNRPNTFGIWHHICRVCKLLFLFSTSLSYCSVCLFWFDRIPATFGDLNSTVKVSSRMRRLFYCSLIGYFLFELTIMVYTFVHETVLVRVIALDFNPFSKVNSFIVECDMSQKGEQIENVLFGCKGAWLVAMNMVVAYMYVTRLNAVFNARVAQPTIELNQASSSITASEEVEIRTFSFSNETRKTTLSKNPSCSMGTPRMQERQNRLLKKTTVIAFVTSVSTVLLFGTTAVTGMHMLPEIDLVINALGIVCFFRFGDRLYQSLFACFEPIPEAFSHWMRPRSNSTSVSV